jgi:uncharacterized membrane protein
MKKYIITSLLCASVIFLFSCKTKKVAVVEKKTEIAPTPAIASGEAYFPKVKAIVAKSCVNCHSEGYNEVKLNSDELISKHATHIRDEVVARKMPPRETLNAGEIQIIETWAKKGGKITD